MIAENGSLATLIRSGARIMESACGFCIGGGQAPPSDAVSIRTNNRNFKGRCGTVSAGVYLTSPEVAAIAAVTGELRDPRDGFGDPPGVEIPKEFLIDDSMFIFPPENGSDVEVIKGPNIGVVPINPPLPPTVKGPVALKVGDKITTDHIMPAGRYLKFRSNVEKYATFVFNPVDPTFPDRSLEASQEGAHVAVVGGEGYGQGSSREHAALCPMYLGVKAVIAKGIERIHSANLVNFGIVPLTFARPEDYDSIDQTDELVIERLPEALDRDGPIVVSNKTKGTSFETLHALSERQKKILKAGGLLNYVKQLNTEE
jgi:aconitate hydratase